MNCKLLTLSLSALVALSFSSCDTLGKITAGVRGAQAAGSATLSPATASKIVVTAEQSLSEAKATIDTFLHLEYNHRDYVKEHFPVIHKAAETLRRNAPDALIAADKVKNTFKHNRTLENQADLMTAVATVTKLAGEAKAYTKQIEGTP